MVGADTQRLVDHLLGQSRVRKNGWLRCALRPGWLLKRRKIKKGHLLALLGGEPWDVRLDKVFFLSMSRAVHPATKSHENTDSFVRER